jgi:NAD(P)-dependent dehydrogenase (short-subunit alcohol dehydrogenase family)
MGLYRAGPTDGVAWITGASSGIGRELALDLARRGYTVAATSRDKERLDELAVEAAGLAGGILSYPGDVADEAAMAEIVERIERDAGPLALAVFNAGVFYPTRVERMQTSNFVRTYEVNLLGVIYGLVPTVARMRVRRRGQIAIIGSITAFSGWPAAAAYGSSKAALNHLAESLKYDLDKLNIRIQVINPGFVETLLTEKIGFRMPFLMSTDRAVERLSRALNHGGFETSFPRRLTMLLRLLSVLPQPLRFALVNRMTGWDRRPIPNGKRDVPSAPGRKTVSQPPSQSESPGRNGMDS